MRTTLTAVTAIAALALTACGGADDTADGGTGTSSAITVTDAQGEKTLDAPAERVVALEWTYAEDLLAVGVAPVGVADIEGYEQWITAGPPLDPDVEDVGTRQEPSLAAIARLEPDLIITAKFRSEANYDKLADIAPTLVFDPYDPERDQYEEMRTTFDQIATAVGKPAEADAVLADLDATYAEAKTALDDAGAAGATVVFAQGFTDKGAPTIRVFTPNSLVVKVAEHVGLRTGWQGEQDPYGFNTVDVEALTQVEAAEFLYVADPKDNVFTGALADNPIWKGLAFVTEDRVHALDPGTWFFGGPLSCAQVVDEVSRALAG